MSRDTGNLADIVEGHDPSTVALVSRGRPTTYGELTRQIAAMRSGLVAAGLGRGDRVVLVCANTRHFVVGYFAVLGIGGIAVPLNPSSPSAELAREISSVGAVAALVGPSGRPAFDAIDPGLVPTLRMAVVVEEASGGGPFDVVLFDDLVAPETRREPVPITPAADDDLAVLMFTSGTAGAPRAARLTHGNLIANIEQVQSSTDPVRADDVVYGVLPLSHIFGLNVMLAASLSAGASIILVQRFDPATFVDTVVERAVTVVPGAPPLWSTLAHQPDVPVEAFAGVRRALTGAARMPVEDMARLSERFGLVLAEGYGLTEASPVVTSSVGIPVRPGSVGKVLDGVEVRIVDEHGDDVLVGDAGEVYVRGPNVFHGYDDDPEATGRVLDADGWLHTGDIATADEDGYLYLVDRAKDLVIVSGFNVYPAEVEEVLLSHPAIAEAGVVGVPHPHTGEAVKAYVVPAPGFEVDEDAVIDYCLDHLARYKCPSKLLVVDELPRNLNGKLLRRELT
jgi:long-chain acyl-CoA synthetase